MTLASRAVWLAGIVVLTAPALAQSPDPAQALAAGSESASGTHLHSLG